MCGRYYVDDETAGEIEKLIRQIDERLKLQPVSAVDRIKAMDIHPAEEAPILMAKEGRVCCGWQHWGFPGFQGKHVIFNARCESAMEKPLFKDSVRHRRIIIPAAGFYEWNAKKEKNVFSRKNFPILFMAGCCRRYEDGNHFVVFTTSANASMKPVHDRMPLILEQDEILDWLMDDTKTEGLLRKASCFLERRTDYEQMGLF